MKGGGKTLALALEPQNQPDADGPLACCGYNGDHHHRRALPPETEVTDVWNETFYRLAFSFFLRGG